jgi:formiminoglutamate deiminase
LDAHKRQQRFINSRERFAGIVEASRKLVRAVPGGTVGVAPHSLRAVTPEELAWLVELARDSVIHIHIAEQTKEVDDCIAWSGSRPVQWLLDHTAVDERWCLVHATHINEAEIQGIAATGAVVGLCPITEANLGDGIFPAPALLGAAGRFGIGSDSNVRIDSAEELRVLEYSQRLAHRGRNVLASAAGRSTARSLFEGALAGGAQVLRAPHGLAVGQLLDVVSLDTEQPELIERREDDILDSWVFSGGRPLVDCVWRAGEKVVINGRHRDREAIVGRYRQTLKRLLTGRQGK